MRAIIAASVSSSSTLQVAPFQLSSEEVGVKESGMLLPFFDSNLYTDVLANFRSHIRYKT
jgi:hypothetical protein